MEADVDVLPPEEADARLGREATVDDGVAPDPVRVDEGVVPPAAAGGEDVLVGVAGDRRNFQRSHDTAAKPTRVQRRKALPGSALALVIFLFYRNY